MRPWEGPLRGAPSIGVPHPVLKLADPFGGADLQQETLSGVARVGPESDSADFFTIKNAMLAKVHPLVSKNRYSQNKQNQTKVWNPK